MKLLFSVLCSFTLLALCASHLCLVNPRQRGSLTGLNTAGSKDCILMSSPCGGRAKENAKLSWGSEYEVIFQKNLDHWNRQNPGYFEINLIDSHNQNMTLTRLQDTGEKSLHIYSVASHLPQTLKPGDYILQVVYVTNNTPARFYQCADITVSH